MKVSLIVAVNNQQSCIGAFLDSVVRQTRTPDEVIVVDYGSTDATVDLVRSHPVGARLEVLEGNASAGRNRAIALATGDVIAVSEAGCVLDIDWLENITDFKGADIVAGATAPVIEDIFAACQYAAQGGPRQRGQEAAFPLSSRSLAFSRVVWEELGGYPEWLDAAEDAWLQDMIRQSRFTLRLEPRAVANWRPCRGYRDIYAQSRRETQGDGRALLRTKKHLARILAYAAGLEMLIMSFWKPAWLIPVILGFGLYLWRPIQDFKRMGTHKLTAQAVGMMAAILLVTDAGRIVGYLSGLKHAHELPPARPNMR